MTTAYAALLISLLGITPLWLDELQQVACGRGSVAALLRWVQREPGGSPLAYLVQRPMVGWFGTSSFSCRIPAALCSVIGTAVFAALCARFQIRSRYAATAAFLALPLQFRYALEARVYSQGLLFSMTSLILLLRVCGRPTAWTSAAYAVSAAAALYSQPLAILPVFGGALWAVTSSANSVRVKRLVCIATGSACVSFAPWYLLQRQAQSIAGTMKPYSFCLKQVRPLGLLHEVSGGGYFCGAVLVLASSIGLASDWKAPERRLLLWTVLVPLLGSLAIDATVNYFFAARQLLFTMPAMVLSAACGIEWLGKHGQCRAGIGMLLVFFASAAIKDYRLATVPKDQLGGQAETLARHLPSASCIAVAPPNQAVYYIFLRPELGSKICGDPPKSAEALAVVSPYSSPAERARLFDSLSRVYGRASTAKIGPLEFPMYRRQ